jgi:Lrp/AsnC family leucine-responsive transcriptional regulator
VNKSLDRFDVQILNLLQEDSLATSEELAEIVPLSASAIARRVRRLRADKLVIADRAVLAPAFLEGRLQAIVHVALHEHAQHRGLAMLRERLSVAEEVQLCYEISGQADLLLIIVTRNMADFNRFADDMLAGDPLVKRYETSFVKKAIKASLSVPLGRDDIR